jgi:putative Mg2+ transporter-C (MgtC) family protein
MRRDVVRGLTTAASVWFTAALGMACGAGLPLLAFATTLGHFIIMLVFPILARRLPRSRRLPTELRITYENGRDLLRIIVIRCTTLRFRIDHVRLDPDGHSFETREVAQDVADYEGVEIGSRFRKDIVTLQLRVRGKRPVSHLIAALTDIEGVREVGIANEDSELD